MMDVTDMKLQSLLKKQISNFNLVPALPKAVERAQALASSRGLMDRLAASSAEGISELEKNNAFLNIFTDLGFLLAILKNRACTKARRNRLWK